MSNKPYNAESTLRELTSYVKELEASWLEKDKVVKSQQQQIVNLQAHEQACTAVLRREVERLDEVAAQREARNVRLEELLCQAVKENNELRASNGHEAHQVLLADRDRHAALVAELRQKIDTLETEKQEALRGELDSDGRLAAICDTSRINAEITRDWLRRLTNLSIPQYDYTDPAASQKVLNEEFGRLECMLNGDRAARVAAEEKAGNYQQEMLKRLAEADKLRENATSLQLQLAEQIEASNAARINLRHFKELHAAAAMCIEHMKSAAQSLEMSTSATAVVSGRRWSLKEMVQVINDNVIAASATLNDKGLCVKLNRQPEAIVNLVDDGYSVRYNIAGPHPIYQAKIPFPDPNEDKKIYVLSVLSALESTLAILTQGQASPSQSGHPYSFAELAEAMSCIPGVRSAALVHDGLQLEVENADGKLVWVAQITQSLGTYHVRLMPEVGHQYHFDVLPPAIEPEKYGLELYSRISRRVKKTDSEVK